MRLLVCGGRDFRDKPMAFAVLSWLRKSYDEFVIIQGGANGADALARDWCRANGVQFITEFARWDLWGKRAGPIRNADMLHKHNPEMVLAFPGGTGTADMVRRSRKAGLIVMEMIDHG